MSVMPSFLPNLSSIRLERSLFGPVHPLNGLSMMLLGLFAFVGCLDWLPLGMARLMWLSMTVYISIDTLFKMKRLSSLHGVFLLTHHLGTLVLLYTIPASFSRGINGYRYMYPCIVLEFFTACDLFCAQQGPNGRYYMTCLSVGYRLFPFSGVLVYLAWVNLQPEHYNFIHSSLNVAGCTVLILYQFYYAYRRLKSI